MEEFAGIPIISFATPADWETWLDLHCAEQQGLWLKIAKKDSRIQSVTYQEALDSALCYGWIDGQKRSCDVSYFLQKFTPRRPRSIWSKVNVEKVAGLTKAGKMKPTGIAAVDAAKADGRWEQAYDSASKMKIPDDFQIALDQRPKAKAFYQTLNRSNAYAVLWRLQTTKNPDARSVKIETLIKMLNDEKKFHP